MTNKTTPKSNNFSTDGKTIKLSKFLLNKLKKNRINMNYVKSDRFNTQGELPKVVSAAICYAIDNYKTFANQSYLKESFKNRYDEGDVEFIVDNLDLFKALKKKNE